MSEPNRTTTDSIASEALCHRILRELRVLIIPTSKIQQEGFTKSFMLVVPMENSCLFHSKYRRCNIDQCTTQRDERKTGAMLRFYKVGAIFIICLEDIQSTFNFEAERQLYKGIPNTRSEERIIFKVYRNRGVSEESTFEYLRPSETSISISTNQKFLYRPFTDGR